MIHLDLCHKFSGLVRLLMPVELYVQTTLLYIGELSDAIFELLERQNCILVRGMNFDAK